MSKGRTAVTLMASLGPAAGFLGSPDSAGRFPGPQPSCRASLSVGPRTRADVPPAMPTLSKVRDALV